MPTFQVQIIVGERPESVPAGMVAMSAPRPLMGTDARPLDPRLPWAGQVIVDPSDHKTIEFNKSMDATVIQWIPQPVLVAQIKERLAEEHKDNVDTLSLIAELPDAETMAMDEPRTVDL